MCSHHRLRLQLYTCCACHQWRCGLERGEEVRFKVQATDRLLYSHSSAPRIDVGGKLLTNHLKEVVSFRQWNMMDETHIMNEVKEACCYVSEDFATDLETCRCVKHRTLSPHLPGCACLTQCPPVSLHPHFGYRLPWLHGPSLNTT